MAESNTTGNDDMLRSERFAQSVIANAQDGIVALSTDGLFTMVNEAFLTITGYRRDDLLGIHFTTHSPPEWIETDRQIFEQVLSGQQVKNYETEYTGVDGTRIPMSITGSLIPAEGNQPAFITCIVRNISEMKTAIRRMAESEERFRELFNNMSNGAAVYQAIDNGTDFIFKDVNRSGQELSKISKEQVLGQRVTTIFPGIKQLGLLDVFQRVWETGQAEICPTAFYQDKRISQWVENYVYKLSTGEIVAIYNDLTEQQKAQIELARSREQYELAVRGSNDGIWDWDLRTNALYLSPQWKRMIGFEDHELPSSFNSFESRIHPDDHDRVFGYVQEYLNGSIDNYEIDFRLRHKDGSYRWIMARGAALREESGKPYRMAGSHTDVTDRKLAEEHLRDSLQATETILEALPFGVFVTDKNKNIRMANSATINLTGWPRKEVVGRKCYSIMCPSHVEECPIWDLDRSVDSSERKILHACGKTIPVFKSAVPITLDGESLLLEAFMDISELKQTQAALEVAREKAIKANQAKSEFLANMSHEIRTPLNAIIGYSHLLESSVVDEKQRSHLAAIHTAGETLLYLIEDILDLSKIESGQLQPFYSVVNIKSLIENIQNIFDLKVRQKNLSFERWISPTVPDHMIIDEAKVRQVLLNLVGNAVKFTHKGSIHLDVSATDSPLVEGTLDIHINICDTGIGIREEKLKEIFEPFIQEHAEIAQKYGGTGLGLNISRRLLDIMHGEIQVESEVGKGSIFTITLHNVIVGNEPELSQEATRQSHFTPPVFEPATVLLVDDIPSNRTVVREWLDKAGLTTIEAENGNQALSIFNHRDIQLVLLDIRLPDRSGCAVAETMHQNPSKGNTPIFAMTASVTSADKEKIDHARFDAFLPKPVNISRLFKEMERFLTVKETRIHPGEPSAPTEWDQDEKAHIREMTTQLQPLLKQLNGVLLPEQSRETVAHIKEIAQTINSSWLNTQVDILNSAIESYDIQKVETVVDNIRDILEE